MLVASLKAYGINCPHMLKVLFLIRHTKQQANSTTAHSNDHTDQSVADTLPTYASNSVHHMPSPTF